MQQFDCVSDFCNHVFEFITGKRRSNNCFLVKKHSEDLQTHGEFSFPNSVKAWQAYLEPEVLVKEPGNEKLLQYLGKTEKELIETSKLWRLSVSKVKEENGRLHIFLHRIVAISIGFQIVNNASALIHKTHKDEDIEVSNYGDDVTSLRVDVLNETLQTVFRILNPSHDTKLTLKVTKSNLPNCEKCSKNIVCGPVLNAKTSCKETDISKADYIRMRQEELTLIAQHRYGLRLSKETRWNQLIEELGQAVTKFELLQSKPTSPVKISFESSTTGANKGPAFVLYNCARMETIKRTFDEKVVQKLYPKLPCIEDTDFSLLTQEEEWNLMFNYILGFPTMLNNCLEVSENSCEFRPQLICNFLYSFVKIFSQYYRKTRILTEPRSHLLPVLYARMHLINAMCLVMRDTLRILGIKHIPHM